MILSSIECLDSTKMYVFLVIPLRVTCPAHFALHLIILVNMTKHACYEVLKS